MTQASNPSIRFLEVASFFGTPTYLTDGRRIVSRIHKLRTSLNGSIDRLLYALKANALPEIVELMRDEGVGLDVVSPGEIVMAQRLGFESGDLFFSANNMTDSEMTFAAERNVIMNLGETSRLRAFGERHPGSRVSLRINTRYGAGHHRHVVTAGQESKFGIPVEQLDDVLSVARGYDLHVVGLHQHIGSGNLEVDPYRRSLGVLFEAAEAFQSLEFVNIGGGLGVPYRPEDEEIDLEELAAAIDEELTSHVERTGRRTALWMEPGRYLVADAGVLLVRVNTIKSSHGRIYAGTDSGMNHLLRPAMYGAYHEILNLSNPSGAPETYHVVGNICESSDFFARDRDLPEVREGDYLAILDAGAYGSSMMSEYNLRPTPAEVFIDLKGRAGLVRERESSEELVDRLLSARVARPHPSK